MFSWGERINLDGYTLEIKRNSFAMSACKLRLARGKGNGAIQAADEEKLKRNFVSTLVSKFAHIQTYSYMAICAFFCCCVGDIRSLLSYEFYEDKQLEVPVQGMGWQVKYETFIESCSK